MNLFYFREITVPRVGVSLYEENSQPGTELSQGIYKVSRETWELRVDINVGFAFDN